MLCFFPRRGCQECQNYLLSSLVSGSVFLFWSAFQSRVSGGAGGEWDAKTRMAGREEESSMSGQNPVETLASQVHANEDSGINIPAILPTESHRHTHTHTQTNLSLHLDFRMNGSETDVAFTRRLWCDLSGTLTSLCQPHHIVICH